MKANQSLLEQLLVEKDYKQAAQLLREDKELLEETMRAFFTQEYKYVQQFSNVFEEFKATPEVLEPYLTQWVEELKTPRKDSFWRNSYRYIQDIEVPEDLQGLLYDIAITNIQDMNAPIAVKAFAMTTCFNIAKHYPELLPELHEVIRLQVEFTESKGVKGRGTKTLKAIEKLL